MHASDSILLVEDDPLVLRAIARLLRGRGFAVVKADGVDAALRAPVGYRAAVIDINLPDGSGLSLYEQLKAKGEDFAVVFFSATVDSEEQRHAESLGEFIPKEAGPEAVVDYLVEKIGGPLSLAPPTGVPATEIPPRSMQRLKKRPAAVRLRAR